MSRKHAIAGIAANVVFFGMTALVALTNGVALMALIVLMLIGALFFMGANLAGWDE